MGNQITASCSEKLKDRLRETSAATGLNQAEIIRRGVVEQIQELGDACE
ncbi:MAG: ribbon-helix-helix protein, CopG family [Candidatus Nanohaloarchaea archaeon]